MQTETSTSTTPVVRIVQDEDAQSPRAWDSNLGVMACWHHRYNLGDTMPKMDPADWLQENAPKGSIVLMLSLYDHSGLTMYVGQPKDRWDSGVVGYLVATPEQIRKEYGVKRISAKLRAKVEARLTADVKVYDEYLQGNVWGYTVEGGPGDGDSCWGFFGSDASTLTAMQESVLNPDIRAALATAWEHRFN